MLLQYGNGTLRLTTRQAYQLHGVLKGDLKSVFSTVIKNMGSTLVSVRHCALAVLNSSVTSSSYRAPCAHNIASCQLLPLPALLPPLAAMQLWSMGCVPCSARVRAAT